jgi:predicted RNase H-like HicB family nuclease
MVEEIMSVYHVAYERDESGWWVASVREVRGCHTQSRTADEARRRIRKAMDLFVDDARSVKLVGNVKLPARASKAIRSYTLRCASKPSGKTSVRLWQHDARCGCCAVGS